MFDDMINSKLTTYLMIKLTQKVELNLIYFVLIMDSTRITLKTMPETNSTSEYLA